MSVLALEYHPRPTALRVEVRVPRGCEVGRMPDGGIFDESKRPSTRGGSRLSDGAVARESTDVEVHVPWQEGEGRLVNLGKPRGGVQSRAAGQPNGFRGAEGPR